MNEETMLQAFSLISDAGEASAKFLMAMQEAESYHFEKAEELLQIGNESLVNAHQKQTNLLQDETRGKTTELSLLMVHAQDHLMNAMILKDVTKSFVRLHEKVAKLEAK